MRHAALAALALLAGCGGADEEGLVVSAAASLGAPLRACAGPAVKLQLGGSDELAAQIRQGVEPDVYAAANTKLPDQLAGEGLLEPPVTFATNELVIAVPADSPVRSLDDLGAEGTRVVAGAESVPVGSYTRDVLDRLARAPAQAIRDNIRSEEPDVRGIVGKLSQGAADAGFVYATDVGAVDGLRTIELPRALQPQVAYGAGVVKGTDRREAATAFVAGLRSGRCADALTRAGFGRP